MKDWLMRMLGYSPTRSDQEAAPASPEIKAAKEKLATELSRADDAIGKATAANRAIDRYRRAEARRRPNG